jgi:outer membrane protein insertion porin family
MRRWLPVLVLLASLARAQNPSAPYPLENLRVVGNQHFTAAQIIAASGLRIGQNVNREAFDAARARLMASGAFENVGYEFKPSAKQTGYEATFDVTEVALLYRYRFEDLPASDDALRAVLRKQEILLGDEIPATPEVLNRYNGVLTRFLEGKVEVSGRLNYSLPGEPTILFRPAGERPRISEVHFTGNSLLDTKKLAMTFADVAIGAEFSDASARHLLDVSIRPLYEAVGHIGVKFPKITSEPSKEEGVVGVSVTVAVDEGPEYTLNAVKFVGVDPKKMKELDDLAKLRTKDTVNFDEVKSALNRITGRYKSNGYLHVAVNADRAVNDQQHTVDLTIKVEPGAQYFFGKLAVEGLDLFGEPAIRKMWGDRQGKPFDSDFPDAFLKEVHDQAMFDNLGDTHAETKVNEDSRTVDITLIFFGAKPQGEHRRRLGEQQR